MKPVIYLGFDPKQYPSGAVESVTAMAHQYEVVVGSGPDVATPYLDRVEILFGWLSPESIAMLPNLKWLQQTGAGADWLANHPEVRTLPFTLTNASGVHSVPISEHMLALALALARDLPASVHAQKDRQWSGFGRHEVFELAGMSVLVLGVGAIGARFARLCAALEMVVVGLRRDPSVDVEGAVRTVGPDDLHRELAVADIVASTLPLTAETRHLLGRKEFEVMKDGAIVINIGRGGTIDEASMIDALRRGKLGGAGLDVFEQEPPPKDSPLWGMDNVLITSHYSGSTPRYNERAFAIFLENLGRYLRGDPLNNVVDKELGY